MMVIIWLYSGPILLCIAVVMVNVQAFWSAFDMVTVENSKTGTVITDLKVIRYNKTAYAISGTIDLTADLSEIFDCELKAYISPQGNSKYTLLPYKIPRDACCTLLESAYWKSLEKSMKDCSDIPARNGNEKFCLALKKSKYTIRQLGFNYNVIPKFFNPGTYKFVMLIYEKGSSDFSSFAAFVARLY